MTVTNHFEHLDTFMGCSITVNGGAFSVDKYLAETQLDDIHFWHKGDLTPRGKRHDKSGLSMQVSSAGLFDLESQVREAISFLIDHHTDLEQLARYQGVEEAYLSFAVQHRDPLASFTYFPPDLVAAAGRIGLGIHLCQFKVEEGTNSAPAGSSSRTPEQPD